MDTYAVDPTVVVCDTYDTYRSIHPHVAENMHTQVAITYIVPPFNALWLFTSYSDIPRRTTLRKLLEAPGYDVVIFFEGTPGGAGINLSLYESKNRPKSVSWGNTKYNPNTNSISFETGFWRWKLRSSVKVNEYYGVELAREIKKVWETNYDRSTNTLYFVLSR